MPKLTITKQVAPKVWELTGFFEKDEHTKGPMVVLAKEVEENKLALYLDKNIQSSTIMEREVKHYVMAKPAFVSNIAPGTEVKFEKFWFVLKNNYSSSNFK